MKEVRINGDPINGFISPILKNGVYFGVITQLLTIDPILLGHLSTPLCL